MTTPQSQPIEPEIMNDRFDALGEEGMTFSGPGALSAETRAEVDIQISTAKRYPRDIKRFKLQAMEMATFDEETAEGCFYSLPRGGKPIEGPSARLAEIIVSAWGNVRADAKVVGVDDKEITAEAMTWDLEKNVAIRVQVKRRITDKYGKKYKDDMITVTGNAACSIALRNSVFKVIPMVYTKAVYQAARKVAIGDIQTLAAKRALMVEHFKKMGVTEPQIFGAVGKENIEQIGLDELAVLKGLATAIKDGDVSVDDAFSTGNGHSEDLKNKTQAAADALKQKLGKTEPDQTPEATGQTDTTDETEKTATTETELSLKNQVSQIVYQLQKDHGVKSKDVEKLLPDGVTKPSELTEEQAADVLPTVQQLLESKQAG
jgi:hypothetical protein